MIPARHPSDDPLSSLLFYSIQLYSIPLNSIKCHPILFSSNLIYSSRVSNVCRAELVKQLPVFPSMCVHGSLVSLNDYGRNITVKSVCAFLPLTHACIYVCTCSLKHRDAVPSHHHNMYAPPGRLGCYSFLHFSVAYFLRSLMFTCMTIPCHPEKSSMTCVGY